MTHEVYVNPYETSYEVKYGNSYEVKCDTLPEGYTEGDDYNLNLSQDIPEEDMPFVKMRASQEVDFWVKSWLERNGKEDLIKIHSQMPVNVQVN